jgi:hypothetical protein
MPSGSNLIRPESSEMMGSLVGASPSKMPFQQQPMHQQLAQQGQPQQPSNMGPHRDDGSSGYDSPDSESFEKPLSQ